MKINKYLVLIMSLLLLLTITAFQSENFTDQFESSDEESQDVNPLTGLPVEYPENLHLQPALVSITNWPPTARPQAGLSFSPVVFELYIGEGMSRFLGLFYGDYPSETPPGDVENTGGIDNQASTDLKSISDQAVIGPIRSGRLPYNSLQKFYNGFLVMSSAHKGVMQNLSLPRNVYGSDEDDINSAMIKVTKIEEMAQATGQLDDLTALSGNHFDSIVPEGGLPASRLWFIYNSMDQIIWQYNPADEAYNRYQDLADGKTFIRASDRLNDAPLTFENVILLFANHQSCTESAYDIDLMYINRAPALLLRDGRIYPISWTTRNEDYEKTTGKLRPIRFIDENGEPFPLKPGQTWIHFVPTGTPVWETNDLAEFGLQQDINQEEWISPNPAGLFYTLLNHKNSGSGEWVTRFFASGMNYSEAVCNKLK